MVTKHAATNSKRYAKHMTKKQAQRFSIAIVAAMGKRESTSVVVTLNKAVSNDYRDDWQANDRLVGIVRHNDLVTVMLSRSSQINKNHLRTSTIVTV